MTDLKHAHTLKNRQTVTSQRSRGARIAARSCRQKLPCFASKCCSMQCCCCCHKDPCNKHRRSTLPLPKTTLRAGHCKGRQGQLLSPACCCCFGALSICALPTFRLASSGYTADCPDRCCGNWGHSTACCCGCDNANPAELNFSASAWLDCYQLLCRAAAVFLLFRFAWVQGRQPLQWMLVEHWPVWYNQQQCHSQAH